MCDSDGSVANETALRAGSLKWTTGAGSLLGAVFFFLSLTLSLSLFFSSSRTWLVNMCLCLVFALSRGGRGGSYTSSSSSTRTEQEGEREREPGATRRDNIDTLERYSKENEWHQEKKQNLEPFHFNLSTSYPSDDTETVHCGNISPLWENLLQNRADNYWQKTPDQLLKAEALGISKCQPLP